MSRSSYTQSTGPSVRTFQTTPPTVADPAQPPKITAPRRSISWPKFSGAAVTAQRLPWIIVTLLIISSLFLWGQYRAAQHKLQTTPASAAASQQVNDTLSKVAKLVVVPTGEKPTIVTVADAAKLKSQTFFANAKDGDKVIVYAQAKQAILYRPSSNQIVTMAPVTGQ